MKGIILGMLVDNGKEDFSQNDIHVFKREVISSTHINFLFGAGVNGTALPQLKDFIKTKEIIEELGGDISDGLEAGIDSIEEDYDRAKIKQLFIEEFNKFHEKAISVENTNSALENLELLLKKIYLIVQKSENRNPSMKQVNIYTLNYDDLVERKLMKLGYLYNSISASNANTKAALMNVIGLDYVTRKYIPSFMISKLHGNIQKPIIPGKAKYRDMLNEDYFEIAFNMKEKLCRNNSILIVIGYSGKDEHINRILQECLNAGLTIYWFKYSESDFIPFCPSSQIVVRGQEDYSKKNDSTKNCFDDLEFIWIEQ